jgi:MFS family permease
LYVLALISLAMNFVGSIGFVAIIPFAKRSFDATDLQIGIAFGAFAGGGALGSLLAARTPWPFGRAYGRATLLDGLLWLPVAWAPSLPLAIAGIALSSMCAGYSMTSVVSWRLRVIPEELVGRVFGVVRVLALGGVFPGSLLGGWMADHLGARQTMAISGIGFLAIAALANTLTVIRNESR